MKPHVKAWLWLGACVLTFTITVIFFLLWIFNTPKNVFFYYAMVGWAMAAFVSCCSAPRHVRKWSDFRNREEVR
jgi:hypothetical protein